MGNKNTNFATIEDIDIDIQYRLCKIIYSKYDKIFVNGHYHTCPEPYGIEINRITTFKVKIASSTYCLYPVRITIYATKPFSMTLVDINGDNFLNYASNKATLLITLKLAVEARINDLIIEYRNKHNSSIEQKVIK
jgi:hypothetical protein